MGPWAKLTQRRWLMREFRFDTLFTTPEFFIKEGGDPGDHHQSGNQVEEYAITGDQDSKQNTLTPPRSDGLRTFEMVSWIEFLLALHDESREAVKGNGMTSLPALRRVQRSWDFLPSDVVFMPPVGVRPLASSTLSDICILTRRLGMTWKECRPYKGAMTAEGSGHFMDSTIVRGVGIVLRYTYLNSIERPKKDMFIWKAEADKMGFGILPGNADFSIPDFRIGTPAAVLDVLKQIDPTMRARKHIQYIMGANPGWPSAFSDLIPLAAPMLRSRGSAIIRVPAPGDQEIARGPSVLTCVAYGFKAFEKRLEQMKNRSDQINEVWALYKRLRRKHDQVWEDDSVAESTYRGMQFLDDVHDGYDTTTRYFKLLEQENPSFRYFDLVKAHIANAVFFWPQSQENVEQHRAREGFWRAEGMHVYFDYLPKYVSSMRAYGFDNERVVKDAWVTLMFRAFCWQRCHFMVQGGTVSPDFYGSRVPVYMG